MLSSMYERSCRQFWLLRGHDEVRRLLSTEEDVLRRTKFKRVRKVLRLIDHLNTVSDDARGRRQAYEGKHGRSSLFCLCFGHGIRSERSSQAHYHEGSVKVYIHRVSTNCSFSLYSQTLHGSNLLRLYLQHPSRIYPYILRSWLLCP